MLQLTLGTTASRTAVLNAGNNQTEHEKTATAIGAAFAGGVAGAIARGRKNIFPGVLVFGALGLAGKSVYDRTRLPEAVSRLTGGEPSSTSGDTLWYPFQTLSDVQYENILQEKLLRLDSDIAIVDEDIRELWSKR